MAKHGGAWKPLGRATSNALAKFAQQMVDAEGDYAGFDPGCEVLCGASLFTEDFFLQIRSNELESPTDVRRLPATAPSTVVFGQKNTVLPIAVWIPEISRLEQNAFAILRAMATKPSGVRVVFDPITMCARPL